MDLVNVLQATPWLNQYLERNKAFIVDAKGVIVYLYESYAKKLGGTQAELIGRPVGEVLPGTKTLEALRLGKDIYGSRFEMVSGETIICDYQILRGADGGVLGVACVTPYFQESAQNSGAQNFELIEQLRDRIAELRKENELYHSQLGATGKENAYSLDKVVGISPPMRELKTTLQKIADTNLVVLLSGETGVGKEVIGNAIHQLSRRKFFPFIKINCAAIPKDLMESELFGYDPGAFSSASTKGKRGKFELAENGTILLDEIGDLPLDMQGKLLRVLQEKEFERVGGVKPISTNARVICSTNCMLEEMVERGTFRRDLYYRIHVVELRIPPLRDRSVDIPGLCEVLITKINRYHNTFISGLEPEAMELLMAYHWPGNVRELEHLLERACVLNNHGMLKTADFDILRLHMGRRETACNEPSEPEVKSFFAAKEESERNAIAQALTQAEGNKSRAAELLGISRRQLYNKLERYQMK